MEKKAPVMDQADHASLSSPQSSEPQFSQAETAAASAGNSAPAGSKSLSTYLQNPVFLLSFIGVLTFMLYLGTLAFPFVMDDTLQVVNNLLIRSWHNLPQAWTRDLWLNFTHSVYYRPFFTTWSILNYSLFQLQPWGWHLGAVLLHIFASLSVFFVARKLKMDYWAAALATMIFAFHPLHVECAACVSAASDPMVTLFFALAFVAFLNSREQDNHHRAAWRVASFLFLACALFTKEMALTFCGVVAVYAWLFPSPGESSGLRRGRDAFVATLPYVLLTAAYMAVRQAVVHQLAAPVGHGRWLDMVLTWPMVLSRYLRMLLVPTGLGGLYYDPYVTEPGLTNFVLPLLAVVAVVVGIWYWARRTSDRVILFAGLWIIATLAPALYLPSFENGDFVHDRYIYLGSIGFAILLAKAIRLLPAIKTVSSSALQITAACVLALAYIAGSYYTQVYWSSNLMVYYRAHTSYPQYELATIRYANELSARARFDRATELLKTVINNHPENDPTLLNPYMDLATNYIRAGNLPDGRVALAKAATLTRDPRSSAVSSIFVAELYARLGDYHQALALCSNALQRDATLYAALEFCGNVQFLTGNYPDAEKLLSHAAAIAPDRAAPLHLLGRLYLQTGRATQGEESLRKAVQLDSTVFDYHYWYARALAQRGDVPDARRELLTALAIKGYSAEAKAALAALPETR
jgi:tetratricopeptide (TPR) repeat protein